MLDIGYTISFFSYTTNLFKISHYCNTTPCDSMTNIEIVNGLFWSHVNYVNPKNQPKDHGSLTFSFPPGQ